MPVSRRQTNGKSSAPEEIRVTKSATHACWSTAAILEKKDTETRGVRSSAIEPKISIERDKSAAVPMGRSP